jgi:PAT family acetyl-CoA transporter-like MFS transporter 1
VNAKKAKPSIRKDLSTIVFLISVYFLQAIPLGLNRSIPLILSARNVTYGAQGTFSFATWPFTLKILWAPIIDLLYIKRIGRRRSWFVPLNLTIVDVALRSCHA